MSFYKGDKEIRFTAFFYWKLKHKYPVKEITRKEYDELPEKDENLMYEVKEEE
jgi:hypothetical protein